MFDDVKLCAMPFCPPMKERFEDMLRLLGASRLKANEDGSFSSVEAIEFFELLIEFLTSLQFESAISFEAFFLDKCI
jgi:hypothetical protein